MNDLFLFIGQNIKQGTEGTDPMEHTKENKPNVMVRVATFIVDKRNLIFLLVGIAIVFSIFSRNWVEVENDNERGPGSDGGAVHYLRLRQGHGGQPLL